LAVGIEKILDGLNEAQLEAVKTLSNVVVTAGAGSGKTKVLASRFAYLVIEKGCKVDEILTLTFTNKATNEMYSRIYGLLSSQNDAASRAAVQDFYKARISTLDSFCAEICALAAPRYGIKSDFTADPDAVYEMADEAALSFVLDNRRNAGIQLLIADNKIRDIARGLFAEIVTEHGSITNPLPFGDYTKKQREELAEKWRHWAALAEEAVTVIKNELPGIKNTTTETYKNFYALFKDLPDVTPPEVETLLETGTSIKKEAARAGLCLFLDTLSGISGLRKIGNAGGMGRIREVHGDFKDNVYPELLKIAAMILNFDSVRDIFCLLDKFQEDFNSKKRIAGMMTFNDVAELAVTILKNEPDIRSIYTEKIKAAMIDEFQDNNELQRELLFLLGSGSIFFVGDQKQSIYRFRGADVSVFKKLETSIENRIRLKVNYRSNERLIQAFNGIFSKVFLEKNEETPDFEAEYEALEASTESAGGSSEPADSGRSEKAHICLFDKNDLSRDAECGAEDVEAAFIAEKIRNMVDGGYQIKAAGVARKCAYNDFAVLERSVNRQRNLEKHFRAFGVPYNSENCAGLFLDAPANDIYSFLRVLVYPKDKSAYAAALRSAFARLSDLALTVCMLRFNGAPFDREIEKELPEPDRPLYIRAGEIYRELSWEIRGQNLTSAELVTKLWYDYGCRYETLWSEEAQIYNETYDYLFELARVYDARGKTPALFIDYLDTIASKNNKLSDFDLPLERRTGVKIMTIHKSKGLEFPIVFVYGCGGRGQNVKNSGLVSFSREWGVSLNLKPPENFPSEDCGNYFFELTRDAEKQKEEAELRRLLYVAMTRAEDTLFLTGIENIKNTGVKSFIDLLSPVLSPGSESGFFSRKKIEARNRGEIRKAAALYGAGQFNAGGGADSMRRKAAFAEEKYDAAPETEKNAVFITRKTASSPRGLDSRKSRFSREAAAETGDAFFERFDLTPAEFGTLVHRVIEERFNGSAGGGTFCEPDSAVHLANEYASVFFESEIGKKSLASPFRKTEYAFLSLRDEDGGKKYVSGVIDLLFEYENEIYIVDYKTDKVVNGEKYSEQMAVYARAARDIFSKKTRAFLFYLREGRLIEAV
jgi:ATP-dependent helicase/nuclease subunit A